MKQNFSDPHIGEPIKNLFRVNNIDGKARHMTDKPWATPKEFSTPKKVFISELWDIFRGSSRFLPISGHSHFASISTPNFGLSSKKLGGTVWDIKKITHNDNGTGPGQNYGETAVFTFCRKVFYGQFFFSKKNTHNLLTDWYLFGKMVIFWLHNFSWTWLEHG